MASHDTQLVERPRGFTIRFVIPFIVFAIIVSVAIAVWMHHFLTSTYRAQCVYHIASVANALEMEMAQDGTTFASFQDYLVAHAGEVVIGTGFSAQEIESDRIAFERTFIARHPNQAFGVDIPFAALDEDLKLRFATYYYKRWQFLFEQACTTFDVPHVRYLIPTGEDSHVLRVFDNKRHADMRSGDGRLLIVDDIEEDFSTMPQLVATWETGMALGGVDVFKNGQNAICTSYRPLRIGDRVMGLICIDGDLTVARQDAISAAASAAPAISFIVASSTIILAFCVHRTNTARLAQVGKHAKKHAPANRDRTTPKHVRSKGDTGKLTTTSHQLASMTDELESRIESIISMSGELTTNARDQAAKLNELARTDTITGLGNKRAFEECMDALDTHDATETLAYTIIMIDLNYLKRINDTYGHERGDVAIRRLSEYVTRVFDNGAAFRIGGDEFCVVLTDDACAQCELKVNELTSLINSDTCENPWERVSAAIGWCASDGESSAHEIFKRADENMYEHKVAMKATRQD